MGMLNFEGVRIKDAPKEEKPKCPKCETVLEEIWVKTKGIGFVEQKQIIMCPYCKSFLGFGTFSI
jgi:hypothetical protein